MPTHRPSTAALVHGALLSLSLAIPVHGEPCEPEMLSSIGGYPFQIEVENGVAYIASQPGGLRIIDVSDPAAPEPLYRLPVVNESFGRDVVVQDDIAYTADDYFGVHFIDVSDPTQPVLIGEFQTPGDAWGVAIDGDRLYVAVHEAGLLILDISSPPSPVLLGSVATTSPARIVHVEDELAFVVGRSGSAGTVDIIDVSDSAAPQLLASIEHDDWLWGLDASDGLLFVTAPFDDFTNVYDISTPTSPTLLSEIPVGAVDMRVTGDRLYLAGFEHLTIADVTDPAAPLLEGVLPMPGIDAWGVDLEGEIAFIVDYLTGLTAVDASNPQEPTVVGTLLVPPPPDDIVADGDFVYLDYDHVVSYYYGDALIVVDVTDTTAPKALSRTIVPGARFLDLERSGDFVFAASDSFTGVNGLAVFDISTPGAPSQLTFIPLPDGALSVTVDDGIAYIGTDQDDLRVIDVTNPLDPVPLDLVSFGERPTSVVLSGNVVYVAISDEEVLLFDASDPSDLQSLGALPTTDQSTSDLFVYGDLLLHAAGTDGVRIFDISTPWSPTLLSTVLDDYGEPIPARRVAVENGLLALSRSDGFHLSDISSPSEPTSIADLDLGPGPQGFVTCVLDNGRLYTDRTGLEIIDVSSCAPSPTCSADVNGDGGVGTGDLFQLLGAWGPCPDCSEDLTGDGAVNAEDLAELLGGWGPC